MNPWKEKKEVLILVLLFVCALGSRLGYLLFLKNNYFFFDHPSSDVVYYQTWAQDIAQGDWLGKDTFWGLPLYPYFLAILKRLTLGNLFMLRFIHLALGSLNCLLIYYLCKKIFSTKVAVLASLLSSLNYSLIFYDWLMMPVTLLIFLNLVIILSLFHFLVEYPRNFKEVFILGILLGLGMLGDGKLLLFYLLFSGYLLTKDKKNLLKKAYQFLVPLSLGVFLILTLVVFRNKWVGGDWVLISAQSGLSFYTGNNPFASGIYEHPEFLRPDHRGQDEDQKIIAEAMLEKSLTAHQVSHFWQQKAFRFILENPALYFKLLIKKFYLFFKDIEKAEELDMILQRDWRFKFDFNPFYIICPLSLGGIWLSYRHQKKSFVPILLIFSQLLFTLIFFLNARHRVTVLPFFIIFEAYFLTWITDQLVQRKFFSVLLSALLIFIYSVLFSPEPIDAKTYQFLLYAKSGPIYAKHHQFQKAQEQYHKALAIFPFDTNTLYNLGNAYLMEGNLKDAEKFYLRSLKICHFNVDALFNLGATYEQMNLPDDALKAFAGVLKYQPESLDAYYRMAQLYQKKGDCEKAKEFYTVIIQTQPDLKSEVSALFSQCEN